MVVRLLLLRGHDHLSFETLRIIIIVAVFGVDTVEVRVFLRHIEFVVNLVYAICR